MKKISSVGSIIKTQRKKLGLTTEGLAKKIGIDRTYISKIENYNLTPSWKILTAIERELKLDNLCLLYIQEKHPEIIKDRGRKNYTAERKTDGISLLEEEILNFISDLSAKHPSTIKAFVISLLNKYKPAEVNNSNLINEISGRIKKLASDYHEYQKIYHKEKNAVIKLIIP